MKIDGTRIKPLRESMGLTIQQLADKVDLSPSAIGMYERGQRTPNLKIILLLAEFFSVDVNYFRSVLHYPMSRLKIHILLPRCLKELLVYVNYVILWLLLFVLMANLTLKHIF